MKHIFKYFIILGLLCYLPQVFAQQGGEMVTGKVFSSLEGGLPMVTITELDANDRVQSSTVTDINGDFSLRIKSSSNRLRFVYLSFKTQTVQIKDRRVFNIEMEEDNTLEEVTVVAQQKMNTGTFDIPTREISTAVQRISTEEFEGISVASIDDALQGRIAGLDIIGSGNVGGGMSMRIRGVTSINANTNPLIVVDGIIYETHIDENFDFANSNEEQYAELLSISPDNIESITVLKDAASTAIWGAKGANGVLSITTKRGRRGPARVQYSYRLSGASQPKGMKMLRGDDYTMLMKEAYFNPKQDDNASNVPELNYDPNFSEYYNYNKNTDWIDEVTQYGLTHDHFLSVSGGGEKSAFLISAGYYTQDGTVIGQHLDRYTTRMNLDYFVSNRIKFSSDFAFTYQDHDENYDKLLEMAYKKMPNLSVYEYDQNGNRTDNYYSVLQNSSSVLEDQRGIRNPVASGNLAKKNTKTYRIIPTFRLQYDLLDPAKQTLRYKAVISFDVNNTSYSTFLPKELSTATWNDKNVNRAEDEEKKATSISVDNNLTWSPRFSNPDHGLMLYASFQTYTSKSRGQKIISYGIPTGIENPTADSYIEEYISSPGHGRNMAYVGAGHYAYQSKYMFDFTIRYDGSTRYGEKRKFGTFPGISFRWNIIDEKFMEPTYSWLSMLSFRPSWGISGNQPKYEYLHFSRYKADGSYMGNAAIRPDNIQLSDLRWEKTTSFNLGADLGFLDDKITMDFNYYYKRTEDLLFEKVSIPTSSGYGNLTYMNVGTMDNKGWELNFGTNRLIYFKDADLAIDFKFNLSNYVNTLIKLDPDILAGINGDFTYENGKYLTRIQENNSYGSIYGFRYKGVYQYNDYIEDKQENAPVARDANGNVIRDNDGNILPMYFGYGTSSQYRFQGGDAIYEDINSDGNINELDIVYLGNSNPKVNGGFGVNVKYKRASMNVFCNFRYGNKIVNYARMTAENMYGNNNQAETVNWRWRKDGDVTDMPRALYQTGYNWLASDRYVEDGSFLRVKYVTFAYSVPAKWLRQYHVNSLSAYLTINNLWCFTNYTGVDPEVDYGGFPGLSMDKAQTPRAKSFTAGITIGF